MTLCIAYKQNGKVYCASDTQITAGDECGKDRTSKIFSKGGITYLCAGNLKTNQAIRYDFDFKKPSQYNSTDDIVYYDFRKAFKEFLKNNPEYTNKKGEFTDSLMIVVDDKIYIFNCDMSITEPTMNYYCIGSGADNGFAALYALNQVRGISTKDKITIALNTAGEFTTGCNKNICWFGTIDDLKE